MRNNVLSILLTFVMLVFWPPLINCGKLVNRQGPVGFAQFPAEELLPPPALSASFPTLRPRSPNQSTGSKPTPEQPIRDLIPPFRSVPPGAPNPNPDLPLLPPIEIPPEKPLTDAEIAETIKGVKDTSFTPTTGKGVSPTAKNVEFILSLPPSSSGLPLPPPQNLVTTRDSTSVSTSQVRFPSSSNEQPVTSGQAPASKCPSCTCTSEVDYICASNGVLYLNSCSFDCANFCDPDLRKAELEFCSSRNPDN